MNICHRVTGYRWYINRTLSSMTCSHVLMNNTSWKKTFHFFLTCLDMLACQDTDSQHFLFNNCQLNILGVIPANTFNHQESSQIPYFDMSTMTTKYLTNEISFLCTTTQHSLARNPPETKDFSTKHNLT